MSESAEALPEGSQCVLRIMPEQKMPPGVTIGIPVIVHDSIQREGIDFSLIEWKKGSMWLWIPTSCIGFPAEEAAA
jgi:hypothetical protein